MKGISKKAAHTRTAAVTALIAAAATGPLLASGSDDPAAMGVQFVADPSGVLGIVAPPVKSELVAFLNSL